MEDFEQASEGWSYGTFSNSVGPVASSEGRMAGGGWVNEPLPLSVKEGKGTWAQAPGADGEHMYEHISVPDSANSTSYGIEGRDMILDMLEEWDSRYVAHRRG